MIDRDPSLSDFSGRALEFDRVRALFEGLAASSLGRRALRELDAGSDERARRSLACIEEMQILEQAGDLPGLSGLSDPVPTLAAARTYSRVFEGAELASLGAFLDANARLGAWLRERAGDVPMLARLGEGLPDLTGLRARMAEIVDERGEVHASASPRLARLRRDARELAARVEKRLKRMLASDRLRPYLSDFGLQRRSGRWVLAVKARQSGRVPGILHDRSQSGETAFVEPREVVEDGNRLAELELDVSREIQRILLELTRAVLERERDLARAAERLSRLELALIGCSFCRAYGARVPIVDEDGGLVLRGARHPLLVEQQRRGELERVVPIDVRLGQDFDLLVITGPNTGGKTLALKTVGLAALMVRLGLPVLCEEGSRVPLYSGLACDIGDEQEISQSLSTFSSHLARIRTGLERADERTLVLIDELGGGTDPDEGAALSDAILEHLLARRVPTLATTHLGKLKEFAFRHARAENACVEFDPETLAPMYRLLVGTPGESNALVIARRLGLDPAIVARAEARLERHEQEVLELMAQVRGAREEAERVRSETEQRLVGVARDEQTLARKQADLERRRDLLEAEAQRGLEERVREARRRLESARALLAQLPAEGARALEQALEAIDAELVGASLTERRRDFLDGLAKGRFVYLPRYKKRCVVTRIDRSRRQLKVRLGKMVMEVPFDEVTWAESI